MAPLNTEAENNRGTTLTPLPENSDHERAVIKQGAAKIKAALEAAQNSGRL